MLKDILDKNHYQYQLADKILLVKPTVTRQENRTAPTIPAIVEAETPKQYNVVISGIVTDEMGESMTGVSVVLKGTSNGVTTNAAGAFKIRVPDNKGILVFMIGFATGNC